MKVLYHTNIPSPYKVNLFDELSKYCDLTVTFERGTASDRDKNWYGKQTGNYREIWLEGHPIGSDSSWGTDLVRHLKQESYDVVVFGVYHTVTAMLAMQHAHNHHIQFILSSDGGFVKEENKLKKAIKTHFISMANAYLSPGGETNHYLQYYGADGGKIFWYPFTSCFKKDHLVHAVSGQEKANLRSKLHMEEEHILLGVGQMIPRKGFDTLLRTVKSLPADIGIYLVGGSEPGEYNALLDGITKDRVHFIEFMSKEELKTYFRAADLLILPTREDIWGLVIVESLSNALPVITTNKCNAGLELITEKSVGRLTAPDDVNGLANAIMSAIDDGSVNPEACLRKVHAYTFECMAEIHINIFNIFLRGYTSERTKNMG